MNQLINRRQDRQAGGQALQTVSVELGRAV
ncbi:MAG: hypothetical protein RLZZ22_1312 [Pseudomonadota bacterium]|jgi:hypothetical protein